MSFLHSTSHYSLRKSLKDLSDHLNFFVACQGRSQLFPAIFRASRNHLVASKHSYMLKLSKTVPNGQSVHPNLTYDLILKNGVRFSSASSIIHKFPLTPPFSLSLCQKFARFNCSGPNKNYIFLYMNDFEATRGFLEALKTAGESWDLP